MLPQQRRRRHGNGKPKAGPIVGLSVAPLYRHRGDGDLPGYGGALSGGTHCTLGETRRWLPPYSRKRNKVLRQACSPTRKDRTLRKQVRSFLLFLSGPGHPDRPGSDGKQRTIGRSSLEYPGDPGPPTWPGLPMEPGLLMEPGPPMEPGLPTWPGPPMEPGPPTWPGWLMGAFSVPPARTRPCCPKG